MKTRIVEVTNGPQNWGKFLIGALDNEWERLSELPGVEKRPLLQSIGLDNRMVLVLDLQTREGAMFKPGGSPRYDLGKHRVWVCPLFEPFLEWLYAFVDAQFLKNPERWIEYLPEHVDLPEAEFQMSGYRRPGPEEARNA